MELKTYAKTGTESGKKKLPSQFSEEVRSDLIKKAVLAVQSNSRQAYGADPRAGKRHSAKLSRRRRAYRGGYGHGISRVPRKILSRNGTRFNWTAALNTHTVGGRSAHAPLAEKDYSIKLNDKERRKAIRSALAATLDKEVVAKRGHKVPENYPLALADDCETVEKTKEVIALMKALKLDEELVRSAKKTIRAGKGKARGRKYKKRVGPLVVVSTDSKLLKSAKNIPGVDVVKVTDLNAEKLAPGCHEGRLTLFTTKALDEMEEKKLFA